MQIGIWRSVPATSTFFAPSAAASFFWPVDLVAQLNASLVGRYTLDREIGRGGMATVYLARDVRHERHVALKVLNPDLGAVVGVERFLAEIKTTAGLQHPNLLPLFDSGEVDGYLFYAMPFIEGESLRSRLAREKQLPVDEAVRIATAIAAALDYAHRHGVVHRDLKPENILMHEGQPLVADFGIALAVSNAGGNRITQTGLSLGTPQYMSPEQATGDRVIDGRTDLYSLGAVLYEMLVGDPPHIGSTSQAVIAKVLTEVPHRVRVSRPAVAPHVDAAVARALQKLPADRFSTGQELVDAISGRLAAREPLLSVASVGEAPRRMRGRIGLKDAIYGILLAAVVAVVAWQWREIRAVRPVVRLQLGIPADQRFYDAINGTNLAISPDGERIAYLAVMPGGAAFQLYVRALDQLEAKAIPSAGIASRNIAFSPDGKWIAFTNGGDIEKVSVDGGPAVLLASVTDVPQGLSWGSAGLIVVGGSSAGLFVVPARGGPSRSIPKPAGEGTTRWPLMLPDGKTVVYVNVGAGMTAVGQLYARSLDGGEPTNLRLDGGAPLAFLEGHLIYSVPGEGLMAVAFDDKRLMTTGSPVPLGGDVINDPTGGVKAAISASGTLVYRSGRAETQPALARGAAFTPMMTDAHDYSVPRFSPDGRQVAFTVSSAQSTDIWVYRRAEKTLSRVTSGGVNQRPEWSPDGKKILFVSDRGEKPGFWWQPADASAAAEPLYLPSEGDPFEVVMSPDGKWLVYRTGPAGHPPRSIFGVALGDKSKSVTLLTDKTFNQMPRISPDGHWLAYQSNSSGQYDVYVRPFPDSGARIQVSTGNATEPTWSRSGKILYYRNPEGIVAVDVSASTPAKFAIGPRRLALTGDFLPNPSHPNYDVSPDDSEFLVIRRAGGEAQTIVVQNWVRELIERTKSPR